MAWGSQQVVAPRCLTPHSSFVGQRRAEMEKDTGSPQTSDQRALDIATCWECGGESPQSRRLRVCTHLCVWGGEVHTYVGAVGFSTCSTPHWWEQVCVPDIDPAERPGVPETACFLVFFKSTYILFHIPNLLAGGKLISATGRPFPSRVMERSWGHLEPGHHLCGTGWLIISPQLGDRPENPSSKGKARDRPAWNWSDR